jgi:hypothetical protein
MLGDAPRPMSDHIKTTIDNAFTESEKEAVLLQVADLINTGKKIETYREERNGKKVLMVRIVNE